MDERKVRHLGVVSYKHEISNRAVYVFITYKHAVTGKIETIIGSATEFVACNPKVGGTVSFETKMYENKPSAILIKESTETLYKNLDDFLHADDMAIAGPSKIISMRYSDFIELALKLGLSGTSTEIFTKLRSRGYDYIGRSSVNAKKAPRSFYFIHRST